MANTYKVISTFTSTTADFGTITFTSIPNTYTDLLILCSLHTNTNSGSYGEQVNVLFNSSSSSFSSRRIESYGTSRTSSIETHGGFAKAPNDNNSPAANMNNAMIYVPDYASNRIKGFLSDSIMQVNSALNDNFMYANLWSDTSPITSVTISTTEVSSRFRVGSSVTIYGIKNS